jgi:hypothetical protein
MRKVVDSNYMQSPKLWTYLSESPKNVAVIIDYAAMEAFKGNTLVSIFKSMEILSEFPKQVLVLKSTGSISTLKGRRCGMTRRMIDKGQTKGFVEWLRGLDLAKAGDKNLQRQLLEAGKDADAHLQRMLEGAETYAKNLQEMSKSYTDAELKILRKNEPITSDIFDKITAHVLEMSAFLFAAQPTFRELAPARELPYTFVFRYALCGYLLALRWLSKGGFKDAKIERIRNDIVDITFAAYGTHFQGVLSDDVTTNEVYASAREIVKLFVGVPPPVLHS